MFVLKEGGELVPLKPSQFALEDDFQLLLEQHPELLAGELIDPEIPRRWILVAREIGVPGEEQGTNLWSADHLFLDQDGIPTIVEVKRQSDTRLRREVVAQMLDYAANGCAFWTVESIRACFEATCMKKKVDPDAELQTRLGNELDTSKFWLQVKTNLEAQGIRLLFVADVIPRELRRIVEFLNKQMDPVEVLALELKHYAGDNGLRTLAPTLFGQTEEVRGLKGSSSQGKQWDEGRYFTELSGKSSPEIVEVTRRILKWMEKRATKVVYGHGRVDGSITGFFLVNGLKLYPLTLWTQGKVSINFYDCKKPPFDQEEKRQELLDRLNAIPGVNLPGDSINRYASIQLAVLTRDNRTDAFLAAMDWFATEVTASSLK